MSWQDIASAPKDGRYLIGEDDSGNVFKFYYCSEDQGWYDGNGNQVFPRFFMEYTDPETSTPITEDRLVEAGACHVRGGTWQMSGVRFRVFNDGSVWVDIADNEYEFKSMENLQQLFDVLGVGL